MYFKLCPRYLLLTLTLFIFFSTPASAENFNPGTAEEFQQALLDAQDNGFDDTITLPAGTFATSQNNSGSTFSFVSTEEKSITIVGAGMGATILDGDMARQILNIDNSGGSDSHITVRGITFQHGDGMGSSGGGLFAESDEGSVTVEDCEFSDNKNTGGSEAGVNVETTDGKVFCNNNVITGNVADNSNGGGSCVSQEDDVEFNGNTVIQNSAGNGNQGGFLVASLGGDISCTGNTITGNEASNNVGGINCNSLDDDVIFTDNTVNSNKALGGNNGGFIADSDGGTVSCLDNTVNENEANGFNGGGECNSDNDMVTVENNTVIRNTASNAVGGLDVAGGGDLSFINNIIAFNEAVFDFGGVVLNTSGTFFVINNTIYDNSSSSLSGGLQITAIGTGDVNIYNNIAYANSSGMPGSDIIVTKVSATILLFNNNFTDYCQNNPSTCDPTTLGANQGGNKGVDPMFVSAMADDFRLLAASDLIDMGTDTAPMLPATDLAGNPRIFGPEPDMGALEADRQIAVDPTALNYGTVNTGDESSQIVTVSNLGSLLLSISGITLSDSDNYSLDPSAGGNPCGSTSFVLALNESCTLAVTFSPQSANTFNATMTISSDDPNDPNLVINLTGFGQTPSNGGCSMAKVPPVLSDFWLWLLPLIVFYLRRHRRSRI